MKGSAILALADSTSGSSAESNDSAILNDSILRNDDDSITNVVRTAFSIRVLNSRLVQQSRVTPDACVLINNSLFNNCALSNSHPRQSGGLISMHLFNRLVIIGAHHKGGVEMNSFRDAAPQANYRIGYSRSIDDAAFAHDRILNLRLFRPLMAVGIALGYKPGLEHQTN